MPKLWHIKLYIQCIQQLLAVYGQTGRQQQKSEFLNNRKKFNTNLGNILHQIKKNFNK